MAIVLGQDYWELLQAVLRRLREGDPVEEIMADALEVLLADWNEYMNEYMEDDNMNLDAGISMRNSISPQQR